MINRTVIQSLVLILVSVISFWAVNNQQEIRDWWILRTYDPPIQVEMLAESTSFNSRGTNIFFASRPELNSNDSFNSNCPFEDRSLVLGCYSDNRIYIFEVDDERLEGVEEVTAAHEMLHAAYARLDGGQKEEVDNLVMSAYDLIDNERMAETIQSYQEDDPESVANELHSILGTEVLDLPEDLEKHYAEYFEDRSIVVTIALSYERVFTSIQDQISALDDKISNLRIQIDSNEAELGNRQVALEVESQRLNDLKNSGSISTYNAGVPTYNSNVRAYNSLIITYKDLVNQHNNYVNERNDLAIQQNNLVQSLDSKYQTIEN